MKTVIRTIDLVVALRKTGEGVEVREEILRHLNLDGEDLVHYRILRRSVDARRKNAIRVQLSVEVGVRGAGGGSPVSGSHPTVCPVQKTEPDRLPRKRIGSAPVVVGTGPAGLLAALALCRKGYKPVVLERGGPMPARIDSVNRFWRDGILDPVSNVQFGEGGAGTFSDGKLTSRSKHPLVMDVYEALIAAGAPAEIVYEQKPHLGTEKVRAIVCRMRRMIVGMGGRFHFHSPMTGLEVKDGSVTAVFTPAGRVETDAVFLAIGNSARDTYEMLRRAGVHLEPKAFAVGLRIEHPQSLIDRAQYGEFAGHPELGAADYRLSWQDRSYGRGVYSFCNCPGGVVVASASEPGGVVTNGMSRHRRASGWSNSAIVVTVSPTDFTSDDALAGIEFQRIMERQAFELGGSSYRAPAMRVEDFLKGRRTTGNLECTYEPGVITADLGRIIPDRLSSSLRGALMDFSKKIRGFEKGMLVGPETRTSSPVRVVRDSLTLESVSVGGLFPIGEGAGYAGGIVSSAVDGLKAVLRVASAGGP